jgi:hypothetical protein
MWLAVLSIILVAFAMAYGFSLWFGKCVHFIIEENCTFRGRNRMEAVFFALALMGAINVAIIVRIALGFGLEMYTVTPTMIRSQTAWPLTSTKMQPVAYLNIAREGDSFFFTGVGEKPVNFRHLQKDEADRLLALLEGLRANRPSANPQDQTA